MTTEGEKKVLDHLVIAWNAFLDLDDKHPDDLTEFRHHLHGLQCMIAWRVARRADAGTWGMESNPFPVRDRERDLGIVLANTTIRRSTLEALSDRVLSELAKPFLKFSETLLDREGEMARLSELIPGS